ncbi:MAG: hypothetical protein NC344_05340 [Bacteroidales bacterium]|nr:hypothetical protein [Bacteroidales bacterium]MCM1147246.1 hypothetical protein [Bacteroidales bacterium]MCM1207213.1 hypothetical protein [Bacillota bacterium]MCM1509723.1 hypothetical protein [Clostridium sp.]
MKRASIFLASAVMTMAIYAESVQKGLTAAAETETQPAQQEDYKPMDNNDPVVYDGQKVHYGGKTMTLGERTIYIDMTLTEEQTASNPYAFKDFRKAAEHFKDGTADAPMQVFVAPGVYWIDDPDDPQDRTGAEGSEPFGIEIRCEELHLTGLTADARNVVLASARGQTQGAVGNFTMINFFGSGLEVRNMTLGNFCNVDLEFPLVPELSRKKRSSAITQAHVAYTHGDRIYAENVRFISRLNMNPLSGGRRILFNRCHLEMTDDALASTGVYLHCTFDFYGQKPFYCSDRGGAVFMDCDFNIKHSNPRTFFCKAAGRVSLIDCRIHAGRPLYLGWTDVPAGWLRCYQHNVRLDGEPYVTGADNPANTAELGDKPLLAAFRLENDGKVVYNTWNLLRGDDGWDPMEVRPVVEGLERRDQRDYSNIGSCLAAEPRQLTLQTGESPKEISAVLKRHANFELDNSRVDWHIDQWHKGNVLLTKTGDRSCSVASGLDRDEPVRCILVGTTPQGHECAVELTLLPSELPAPAFTKKPVMSITKGLASLDYSLDLGARKDGSLITWYRTKDRSGREAIPVAVSRNGNPLRNYHMTAGDCGYYLMAVIEPKHLRCKPGEPIKVFSEKRITMAEARSESIDTDFLNMPVDNQPKIIPGFWTTDCHKPKDTEEYDWEPDCKRNAWIYGEGINGAKGTGLLQAQRGARLMYTPVEGRYGDMELILDVDPAKTAGQGFGSATGQYMDVCIKFDTRTLTGYALRIERTTKYSKAVDFSLVRYDNGTVRRMTSPVSSVCYRTGCSITLRAAGSLLTAHVETSTPVEAYAPELTTSVDLSAKIVPNRFGGIAVQHTGTCGENITMLRRLRLHRLK